MKPVLIIQHLNADGPAYLETWLQEQRLAFEVVNAEDGDPYPEHIGGYSALAVLGGEMSANDPLHCLREGERLICEAVRADVPVIGHCLGGQLMARALGAEIVSSPMPEIGWHAIRLLPGEGTRAWFGDERAPVVMQWHYDAFQLPDGAVALAQSDACPWQAFTLGRHLAMQFHIEIDEAKLHAWVAAHDERFLAATASPTVHSAARMLQDARRHLAASQALADRLYTRWIALAADRA